jgi:DNA (cytosine-5)-methyltransferase 1
MIFRVLDLFSGIGGFSYGLERTGGFKTSAFCEIDPFCRAVLRKHWPNVPCYTDVRKLDAARLRADGIAVDAVCGGFPCQDISLAGKGAGILGERSGLWSELARIIGEVRPLYVLLENVAALLGRGLDRVLGDLAALGYDAEWHCIPASAIGAPHVRDRIWIVAYPCRNILREQQQRRSTRRTGRIPVEGQAIAGNHGAQKSLADPVRLGKLQSQGCEQKERGWPGDSGPNVADTARAERERRLDVQYAGRLGRPADGGQNVSLACRPRLAIGPGTLGQRAYASVAGDGWWSVEPDVGRVAHGIPARVDRVSKLGNAVVPQIPEMIGHAILAYERMAA